MTGPAPHADTADLVVIGAGVVGAAAAYFAARAGLRVTVVDRGPLAGGTSSAGEGNLLVSDKEAGPELDLALFSQRVWREDLAEHAGLWEFEAKGGLVVAATPGGADALAKLVLEQRAQGIEAVDVPKDELPDY
ncbi:MAG: FAD-binding oxidoreductase, partial [Streptomyces sp.]|nr:FAD-binding oxidoreductase [Streptomyces sp.]